MKKIILFTLFTYSLSINAQKLQFIGDSTLSGNIGEWKKYNQLFLKTNYDSSIFYKFILTVHDNENNLVISSDSMIYFNDSIGMGDTLYADLIFNTYNLAFHDAFGDYFITHYRLKNGNYSIKIKFYDTFYNFLDSAVKIVEVKEEILPALISPLDNTKLWDSTINSTFFSWLSPRNLSTNNVFYNFRIYEIDSNQLYNLEYAFDNNNYIYNVIITDTTHIVNIDLMSILDSNKWYAWSVKTFYDTNLTQPIITNKGIAYPFLFSKSTSKRSNDDPLCCENNNSGFEDGTFDGWITDEGLRKMVDLTFFRKFRSRILFPFGAYNWNNSNPNRDHFVITNKPNLDLIVNLPQVPDNGGLKAAKLGSVNYDGDADKLTRTFTVTECNSKIKLNYMFILNDGQHQQVNQAVFYVRVFKGRNNGILDNIQNPLVKFSNDYDPNMKNVNGVAYRYWNCHSIDLSNFIGETVTIEIVVSDCAHGGHFGYAYIDFCVDNDPVVDFSINQNFCNLNNPIIANGSSSVNLTNWIWTVQSCNINGDGIGKEIVSVRQYGFNVESNKSLNDMIKKTGFSCGYFRVKLGGGNDCSNWTENVKLILISCPQKGLAGPDKCCSNGSCNFQIGKPAVSGNTYLWSSNNCLSSSNIANPYFNTNICNPAIFFPISYVVSVTDQYGCQGFDTMTIYDSPPTITNVTQDSTSTNCELFLGVTGIDFSKIEWHWIMPGSTKIITVSGQSISFPRYSSSVVVTVTLTNPCGSVSTTTTVSPRRSYKNLASPRLTLIFNNALNTQSPVTINRYLNIWEYGLNDQAPNAYYGATDAILHILNGYGGIDSIWGYHNTSFTNGQLKWNGYLNGKVYPSGEVNWRLGLKNCNSPNWYYTFNNIEKTCTKYYWVNTGFLSWRKACKTYTTEILTTEWNLLYVNP